MLFCAVPSSMFALQISAASASSSQQDHLALLIPFHCFSAKIPKQGGFPCQFLFFQRLHSFTHCSPVSYLYTGGGLVQYLLDLLKTKKLQALLIMNRICFRAQAHGTCKLETCRVYLHFAIYRIYLFESLQQCNWSLRRYCIGS